MAVRRDRVRLGFQSIEDADACWSRHSADEGESYREALSQCFASLSERARLAMRIISVTTPAQRASTEVVLKKFGALHEGTDEVREADRLAALLPSK